MGRPAQEDEDEDEGVVFSFGFGGDGGSGGGGAEGEGEGDKEGMMLVPTGYLWLKFLRSEGWDPRTLDRQHHDEVVLRWEVYKLESKYGMLDSGQW